MQFGHTVYAMASHYGQTGHMHLVVPEDRDLPGFVFLPGETLLHGIQPAPVNFVYNEENTGQQFLEHGYEPALQRLRQNGVVGIGYGIRSNTPGIFPAQAFFIH